MVKLIENGRISSAIFAGCDETALGGLMTMREFGLSAPENVSIIGIDDHQMSWFLGLTTMAQPVAGQGAFAATLLIDRLHRTGLPQPAACRAAVEPSAGNETGRAQEHAPPPNRMKQMT